MVLAGVVNSDHGSWLMVAAPLILLRGVKRIRRRDSVPLVGLPDSGFAGSRTTILELEVTMQARAVVLGTAISMHWPGQRLELLPLCVHVRWNLAGRG